MGRTAPRKICQKFNTAWVTGTPASFDADDWTNADVTNRQIKPGDTKTLELVTTAKGDKDGRFVLGLSFAEGCTVQLAVETGQLVTAP